MGVDFLYTKRNAFKSKWDRGKAELSNPTLFSNTPVNQRTLNFLISENATCSRGAVVVLRQAEDGLVAYASNNEKICVCGAPPSEILSTIKAHHGAAVGVIVQVNPLSRTADISVE